MAEENVGAQKFAALIEKHTVKEAFTMPWNKPSAADQARAAHEKAMGTQGQAPETSDEHRQKMDAIRSANKK